VHFHGWAGAFVYMLSGWVDLEFEDGQKLRIQSGESLYIPGGLRHNETAASKDLELLEISVPADMGTVACEPPEGWSKRDPIPRSDAFSMAPLWRRARDQAWRRPRAPPRSWTFSSL
jgi:uncharacterized protein YjlB